MCEAQIDSVFVCAGRLTSKLWNAGAGVCLLLCVYTCGGTGNHLNYEFPGVVASSTPVPPANPPARDCDYFANSPKLAQLTARPLHGWGFCN